MPELRRRIRLYPTQAEFCHSDAFCRGFVGGRGAGKSHVGAYDLIRRTKPGRLYGAYAPTYTMLKDAALRSFLSVGRELNALRAVNLSEMRVTMSTGAEVLFRSLDNPERARGPNLSGAWIDEASLVDREAYGIVIACLREGGETGWLSATFTPKGQRHWTYEVFGQGQPNTALFQARTLDNPFLPSGFYDAVRSQYTAAYALQELEGRFISDVEGALWKRATLDDYRVRVAPPELVRIVVAIDPASTSGSDSDETGIIVAGLDAHGHGYVLEDCSLRATPHAWGSRAVAAYHAHEASRIVAETNQGGEMVELTIRTVDREVPYRAVHASRGKATRAEPIAALYEQGRVHHVGYHRELEDQMCMWVPGDKSPDRMDALVWALSDLMLKHAASGGSLAV